jgi:hypothetical protein
MSRGKSAPLCGGRCGGRYEYVVSRIKRKGENEISEKMRKNWTYV